MSRCIDCNSRHRASGERCLTCKTAVRRLFRDAKKRGWTVDVAGGHWWVWDARGDVVGQGERGADAVRRALAGEPVWS